MNILDAIQGSHGGGAIQQLGQQFGLEDSQVTSALSALVPALAAGFHQNISSQQGLDGLLGALTGGDHQRYVDDASALAHPDTIADGNGILNHVLGNKEVSRQIATQAAGQTGIGADVLKGMLPIVAAMMMGAMSKRVNQSGATASAGGGMESLLGMLAPALGGANQTGSPLDGVMGVVGKLFSGR